MSARAPRLSVVMPVYNGARELESSLPALRARTYRDFELIVVDDGSRDDIADVLARFPPDRVVTLDRNLGHCEARNRGAAEARGAILLFTDADVVVRPGTLARVAERFEDEEVRSLIGLYGLDHPYRTLPSLYKNTWIHYTYRNAPAQARRCIPTRTCLRWAARRACCTSAAPAQHSWCRASYMGPHPACSHQSSAGRARSRMPRCRR